LPPPSCRCGCLRPLGSLLSLALPSVFIFCGAPARPLPPPFRCHPRPPLRRASRAHFSLALHSSTPCPPHSLVSWVRHLLGPLTCPSPYSLPASPPKPHPRFTPFLRLFFFSAAVLSSSPSVPLFVLTVSAFGVHPPAGPPSARIPHTWQAFPTLPLSSFPHTCLYMPRPSCLPPPLVTVQFRSPIILHLGSPHSSVAFRGSPRPNVTGMSLEERAVLGCDATAVFPLGPPSLSTPSISPTFR